MFKNKSKTSLVFNGDKPRDSTNYEQNAIYNASRHASTSTAMYISMRIKELNSLSGGDHTKVLNDILREISIDLEG